MSIKETPIEVIQQGKVKLCHDTAYCVVGNEECVCFFVDLRDKRVDVSLTSDGSDGVGHIWLDYIDEDVTGKYHLFTCISFPAYTGWTVHAAVVHKSTLSVALRNPNV